jgi:hypothetical protein
MSNVIILKDKLSKLREIAKTVSPQYDDRKYQLNPVIENTVLEEFEKRYQIRLPEDYRDFLLHVGNGGIAGPGYYFYGIGYEKHFFRENLPDDVLKKPFLWSKAWQPQTVEEFEEVMSRTEEPLQGAIFIVNYGCSVMGHLVVSGTERGNIWVQDFGSENGIWPEGDFFEWYNTWLDFELARWFDHETMNHFQSIKAEIQARIPLLKSFGENVDIIDIYLNSARPIEICLIVQFQYFDFQKIKKIKNNALQDKLLENILSFIVSFLDDANNIYNDNFLAEENGYKKFKLLLSHFNEKGTVPYCGGYCT